MTRSFYPDKKYKDNHAAIFGKAKGATGQDEEKVAKLRQDRHNKEAEDGKKDAQYYLDNERRVSADPEFKPSRIGGSDDVYKTNWDRIFRSTGS